MGGYIHYKNTMLKMWSRRIPVPCLSSAEAELFSIVEGLKESISVALLLQTIEVGMPERDEHGFYVQVSGAYRLRIRTDSQAAMHISGMMGLLRRVRHLELRVAVIQYYVACGRLVVEFIPGSSNGSDALTKPGDKDHQPLLEWECGLQPDSDSSSISTMMQVLMSEMGNISNVNRGRLQGVVEKTIRKLLCLSGMQGREQDLLRAMLDEGEAVCEVPVTRKTKKVVQFQLEPEVRAIRSRALPRQWNEFLKKHPKFEEFREEIVMSRSGVPVFIEVCCRADSSFKRFVQSKPWAYFGVSEDIDMCDAATATFIKMICEKALLVIGWISTPCTSGSPLRHVNFAKDPEYLLKWREKVKIHRRMWTNIRHAFVCPYRKLFLFQEWPTNNSLWGENRYKQTALQLGLQHDVDVKRCCLDRIHKNWTIRGNHLSVLTAGKMLVRPCTCTEVLKVAPLEQGFYSAEVVGWFWKLMMVTVRLGIKQSELNANLTAVLGDMEETQLLCLFSFSISPGSASLELSENCKISEIQQMEHDDLTSMSSLERHKGQVKACCDLTLEQSLVERRARMSSPGESVDTSEITGLRFQGNDRLTEAWNMLCGLSDVAQIEKCTLVGSKCIRSRFLCVERRVERRSPSLGFLVERRKDKQVEMCSGRCMTRAQHIQRGIFAALGHGKLLEERYKGERSDVHSLQLCGQLKLGQLCNYERHKGHRWNLDCLEIGHVFHEPGLKSSLTSPATSTMSDSSQDRFDAMIEEEDFTELVQQHDTAQYYIDQFLQMGELESQQGLTSVGKAYVRYLIEKLQTAAPWFDLGAYEFITKIGNGKLRWNPDWDPEVLWADYRESLETPTLSDVAQKKRPVAMMLPDGSSDSGEAAAEDPEEESLSCEELQPGDRVPGYESSEEGVDPPSKVIVSSTSPAILQGLMRDLDRQGIRYEFEDEQRTKDAKKKLSSIMKGDEPGPWSATAKGGGLVTTSVAKVPPPSKGSGYSAGARGQSSAGSSSSALGACPKVAVPKTPPKAAGKK